MERRIIRTLSVMLPAGTEFEEYKRSDQARLPPEHTSLPIVANAIPGLVEWLSPFEEVRGVTGCFCCKVESVSGTSKNLFHCITQSAVFLTLQQNQAARDFDFCFAFGLAILKSLVNFSLNCFQVSVHFPLHSLGGFTEF
jgi:hypothetical protein